MICVIGSMNLDRIARLERAPDVGETVVIRSLESAPGGKGGNVAAAAARLGAAVAMVARVGRDAEAGILRQALADAGVDLSSVEATDEAPTGSAWIWVEAGGENRIGVFAGANSALTPAVIDGLARGPASPFAPGRLVVLNLEIPVPAVESAISRAQTAGARVLLNLSPVGLLAPSALGGQDLLVVNGVEGAALCAGKVPGDLAGAVALAAALRSQGPGTVVVTLGDKGAAAADADGSHAAVGVPVPAVDTTGCGDAFLGALAACLDAAVPLAQALALANAAGAFTATRPGAQSAQPDARQLRAFARERALDLPALDRVARGADGDGALRGGAG